MPFPSLGNVTVGVSADLTGLDRGLKLAGSMLTGFARLVGAGGAFGLGQRLGQAVFGSPADFISDSVKKAAQYETAVTQFAVLLGQSEQKAARMVGSLRQFAAESPLTLTESLEQAKKLLSAGIGEGQIVPTLRVLSDLAVGDTQKLRMLSVAYTQVVAAGRLYGTELRQFTETGIPLIEALAATMTDVAARQGKVRLTAADVREEMEAGRVSARDLAVALKALTDRGGQFFDMTRKGADTTIGLIERVRDGWQEFQRAFGRAVIEESGLKESLRDLTKFEAELAGFVDSFRPAIRFVADAAKGLAQIIGEVARNGPVAMKAFVDGFRVGYPDAARFFDAVAAGVKKLQDLRADPQAWADIAFDMGEAFAAAFDTLFGRLGAWLADLRKTHVQPILDDVNLMARTWQVSKDIVKGFFEPVQNAGRVTGNWIRETFNTGDSPETMALKAVARDPTLPYARQVEMTALTQIDRLRSPRNDAADRANNERLATGLQAAAKQVREAAAEYERALKDFVTVSGRAKTAGTERDAEMTASLIPSFEKKLVEAQARLSDAVAAAGGKRLTVNGVEVGAAAPAKPASTLLAEFRQATKDALRALAADRQARGVSPAEAEANARLALFGGAALGTAHSLRKVGEYVHPPDTGERFQELAKQVREQFADPGVALRNRLDDLQAARGFGRITDREFALASAAAVRDAQGVLGDRRLAPAAELGSREAAEMQSRLWGGAGGDSPAGLLRRIAAQQAEELAEARRLTEAFQRGNPNLAPVLPYLLPMR